MGWVGGQLLHCCMSLPVLKRKVESSKKEKTSHLVCSWQQDKQKTTGDSKEGRRDMDDGANDARRLKTYGGVSTSFLLDSRVMSTMECVISVTRGARSARHAPVDCVVEYQNDCEGNIEVGAVVNRSNDDKGHLAKGIANSDHLWPKSVK